MFGAAPTLAFAGISPLLTLLGYALLFCGTALAFLCALLFLIATPLAAIGLYRRSEKISAIGGWMMAISGGLAVLFYPIVVDFCAVFLIG